MTKKKTIKHPISWAQNGGGKEDFMEWQRITRQVAQLADDARSAGKRWDYALWQTDQRTLVLVAVEIAGESFGVYLGWLEFENAEQKADAVKRLRREVRVFAKLQRLEPPKVVKQLEEVRR